MSTALTLYPPNYWLPIKDGDARGRYYFQAHYSCGTTAKRRQRKLFVGPGEKLVLLAQSGQALIVWRKFVSDDGQEGVNCSIFRNEAPHLHTSSTLLKKAQRLAWEKWPNERLYTYVNPQAVRTEIPGWCFRLVGWTECGMTKVNKLIILEKYPRGQR